MNLRAARALDEANLRGVVLTVVGPDALHFKAPPDAITPDLVAALKAHKAEVIRLLTKPPPDFRPAPCGPGKTRENPREGKENMRSIIDNNATTTIEPAETGFTVGGSTALSQGCTLSPPEKANPHRDHQSTQAGVATPQASGTEYFPGHLPRVILDLETYYDADYSLEKQGCIPYVFDPRFRVHGIAVAYPDGRTEFRTDVEALLRELQAAYGTQLEGAVVVCHNATFDLSVLRHRYGLAVKNPSDTMLISRLLHGAEAGHSLRELSARYGLTPKGDLLFMKGVRNPTVAQLEELASYARNDAQITAALADRMWPAVMETPIELWAIGHSIRGFVERLLPVDADIVAQTAAQLEKDTRALVAATGQSQETLRSTKHSTALLNSALAATGRELPMKPGKKGPIPAIAKDDPAYAELLADPDPVVRSLMAAKVALASESSARGRLEHLGAVASVMGGKCPFLHSYHKAGTGRYAGGDGLNIQNLKKVESGADETSIAAGIRRAIHAPPGHTLVPADASQIEARVLASVSGQKDLHDSFADGRDVYCEFASQQFGREVRKPKPTDTPEEAKEFGVLRQIGKKGVLGLGYGMGVEKFISTLKSEPSVAPLFDSGFLGQAICARIVHGYRGQYPCIPRFWKDTEDAAFRALVGETVEVRGCLFELVGDTLYIGLPSGRCVPYPGIRATPPHKRVVRYIDRDGIWQQRTVEGRELVYGAGKKLYGGLLVENITQAIARDLLVGVMYRVESTGLPVVLHCHDSVTVCVPVDRQQFAQEQLVAAWRTVPQWAEGLVLDAEAEAGYSLADL